MHAIEYDYMIFNKKEHKKKIVSYDGYINKLKELSEIIENNIESISCAIKDKSSFELHKKSLTLAYNSMIDDQIESFIKSN